MLERVLGSVRYAAEDALDDALDAGASALTAAEDRDAMGRALVAAAVADVRRCWDGGWLPADLVRMVRRERGADRLPFLVDMIAAAERDRAGRPGPGAGDERWAGQLRELDARVWWGGDGGYLEALAQRERAGRFETAGRVLDVLREIGRLPRIPPVGPRTAHRPAGDHRMLGRIRALLAKAESTGFPEEAEALSAKAQELMARYSIDEALLGAARGAAEGEGPGACRIGVDAPYEPAKALLLDAVAEANRCRAVWSSELGFSTVVGFEADLELVELLYTSLLLQGTTAMNRAADRHHARGRSRRTRDFRESFLIAYAGRIRDRLTTATRQATEEAVRERLGTADGPGAGGTAEALPVLAAREVAVGQATERMFPTTTAHRLRGRDAAGWEQGEAAADRADLGPG
ncbi:hypothetical protein ACZ90_34005 [Streptomyces albus subsp. albus]|nr:hypothetical protein ACZ90_34005 [Streptomyces albus subsp. albus]